MAKNKKLGLKYTLGSDPELMLFSVQKNRIVSSIPVLKTDKHNPIVLNKQKGIKAYADNVLLETAFNPCNSKDEMIGRFREVFRNIHGHLGDKYRLIPKAAHEYPQEDLKPGFGIDPSQIGCDPSFNAWSITQNEPTPFKSGLRTGSCHFHIGNEKLTDFDTRIEAIKILDIYLGCGFVLVDKDVTSKSRRMYYGQSSEHRPTDYGLEYRVLSPYVLNSPELVDLALDVIDYSMGHIKNNTAKDILAMIEPEKVQKSINDCNGGMAKQVLMTAQMPSELIKRLEKNYQPDFYKDWEI